MKKVLAFILVLILCISLSGVALAASPGIIVKDYNTGDTINWIQFKLHPLNELTDEVDTVWISPLQDYEKDLLHSAAEAAYPGATVNDLGVITMSGYDAENDYIFDYFGPFTAKVLNPNVHKGDKVVVFILNEEDQSIKQIDATHVKKGSFKFRDRAKDAMEADCVYVILHNNK